MASTAAPLSLLLLIAAAGVAPSSGALHGCPKQDMDSSPKVDMDVCGAKDTVVIHDNVQQIERRLKAKKVADDVLEQCRFKPDQYREGMCTAENKASWSARAAAGVPPNNPEASCVALQKPSDVTVINCSMGFHCEGHKAMCSLVQEECHNWEYQCEPCDVLQKVSCCNQCHQVRQQAVDGTLNIANKAVDNVECYDETTCSNASLNDIFMKHQDVCVHDDITGVFSCEVSVQCEVGKGKTVSEDASWQCMVTPCDECCTEECRAQCCDKCLSQVCGAAQDGEPHFRMVCMGCEYKNATPPTWDLPPYHKTEFKNASLLIKETETTNKFDEATCKKIVPPLPTKGEKLPEDEALCRLSVSDYTEGGLCTDLLGKWKEICGLPIDGDACAVGGDLELGCLTEWGCKGGDVLCSLYQERYDSLVFDCKECSDPLRFKCCQECFELMDKQEFDEPHKRGVICGGCSREELAAVKGAPFSPPGQIKVDAHAGEVECKYEDGCKTGKVVSKVEDASWKCLVTPCDACGDNMTAKALCCVECLSQTCTSDGKDGVRRVCTGCDELPKSTVTTTFMPEGSGTTPKPVDKVQNVNVSDELNMAVCRSPNTTNLTVEEVLGGKPPAGREKDVENCTTSPQLQCPRVESLLATWQKNYNTLRHDLDACSVNKETGRIECVTERKCEGGHQYCFLAESGSASVSYDCAASDISELQKHSCCAACHDAVSKAAEGKLKDASGLSYSAVTCKGCAADDLSGITDTSCSAAAGGDHCTVDKTSGSFTCTFREDYSTGKKTVQTEDLSWQCTTTPCDVCSHGEESQAENDRLRSQCCVNCLTAASKTCSNNRTRNICQGCQEEEANRIASTTSKSAIKAAAGFLGLSKASSAWATAGFVGLLAFAGAMVVAVARRFPDAGAPSANAVEENFVRRGYTSVPTGGAAVE